MDSEKTPAQLLASSKSSKSSSAAKPANSKNFPLKCSLKQFRKPLGLTLDDVANAIGMSTEGYWQIEKGSNTKLTTAFKLCEFFGKSISEIWSRNDTYSEAEGGE